MAFSPAWGGAIPLVRHRGFDKDKGGKRRGGLVGKIPIIVGYGPVGRAAAGWRLFLATGAGLAFAQAYSQLVGTMPPATIDVPEIDQLFKEIGEFLKRQDKGKGKKPGKGLGFPIPGPNRRDDPGPGIPVPATEIQEGYKRLIDVLPFPEPTRRRRKEKESDDEKAFKAWFDKRFKERLRRFSGRRQDRGKAKR